MKKYLIVFIFLLLLTGCKPDPNTLLTYDEEDLIFEVGEDHPDYDTIFLTEEPFTVDDTNVNYATLGTYEIVLTIKDNEYLFDVEIVDTTSPVINLPEGFVTAYELGEVVDLSGVTVTDNYDDDISFASNLHELDCSVESYFTLTLTAHDSSGNLTTKAVEIRYIDITEPTINIVASNIDYNFFSIEFIENDPDNFKVESYYQIFEGSEIIYEGFITSTNEFNFANLKQNTTYMVYLHFDYQYPGEMIETMMQVLSVTTESLYNPELYFENGETVTATGFEGRFKVIDPDDLIGSIILNLVDDNQAVIQTLSVTDTTDISFSNLDPGRDYKIIVLYEYDFMDGLGTVNYEFNYDFSTEFLNAPSIDVTSVDLLVNQLDVHLDITDVDNTFTEIKVILIENVTVLEEVIIDRSTTLVTFDELTANTEYEIRVVGIYSIQHGTEETQVFYEDTHSTLTN
jgi:hypothetical protein